MNYNSPKNQSIKSKFIGREVVYCVSSLVSELTNKMECFPDYEDELIGIYSGIPNYEDAAKDAGWEESVKGFENKETGDSSDAKDWKELCEAADIDPYEIVVFEHWIVTDWLADKLESYGEKVIRDFFGLTIWCRPTTGQAILLDGVISAICEEMEILSGQKNDWGRK